MEDPCAPTARQVEEGEILRNLAPKLASVVRAILGSHHPDVDDAIQQTLIGFVQALPSFRGDCEPIGFGRVIAVRTAMAMKRKSRTQESRTDGSVETDQLAAGRPSPRDVVFAERRKYAIRALLDELPNEQGEAIAMRIILGYSLEEIARHANAPVNTIRSRLRLAKERLRARIEQDPSLRETLEVA